MTTLRHRSHQAGARTDQTQATPAIDLPRAVAGDLATFARREASDRIVHAIDELNQRIDADEPWKLAGHTDRGEQLTKLLDRYSTELRNIAQALAPITPELSQRALRQLDADPSVPPDPVFARLDRPARSSAAPA